MAKKLAMLFGVVFVLVGILGFISNPIVGANGFFVTDTIHNIIHLLVGVLMLMAASKMPNMVMKTFGAVYVLLAILGFIEGGTKLLGFVAYNAADNWLHLVLGIILLILGMTVKDSMMMGDNMMMKDKMMGSGMMKDKM